jgi:hypothetical protein
MVAINSAGNLSEFSNADMLAGVDGIPDGWLAVLMQPADQQHSTRYEVRRVHTLRDLIDTVRALRIIAIDIPIGLADAYQQGGRNCDRLARSLLSATVRRSSVFPTPFRGTLAAATWEDACIISRGSANKRGTIARGYHTLPGPTPIPSQHSMNQGIGAVLANMPGQYRVSSYAQAATSTHVNDSHDISSETHVGDVHVHTAATDAKGIARDLGSALRHYAFVPGANMGLS